MTRDAPASLGVRVRAAYEPDFLRSMTVSPEHLEDEDALAAALDGLSESARAAADTMLAGVGAGNPIPARLRPLVEREGDELWRMGLLLPRLWPGFGATIDPRHYASACRLNEALGSLRPLAHLRLDGDPAPSVPPSDSRWDAVVVAAALECDPPALNQDGSLRKDHERRLLERLGPDDARWSLALAMAQALHLARPAAGRLYGFPDSRPRSLTDPPALLQGGPSEAASALLRLVRETWVPLESLLGELSLRCPEVLCSDAPDQWERREAAWFREAADVLHRAGVLDVFRSSGAIVAVRRAGPRPERREGFLLTPDREALIAPGELASADYGRLCRMAPYVDGDVVCRHRLSRDGVSADLAAGNDDVIEWLAARSRTGVPGNVRSTVELWVASAVRVTLLTGVTVVEEEGAFTVAEGGTPAGATEFWYNDSPSGWFRFEDEKLVVPFGQDPLTLRALAGRIGDPLPPRDGTWRWQFAPRRVSDAGALLDRLRPFHQGELPGELEAGLYAAAGKDQWWTEDAVVVHLPEEVVAALRRDRIAGPLLGRDLGDGQSVVDRNDVVVLDARLAELGFHTGKRPE